MLNKPKSENINPTDKWKWRRRFFSRPSFGRPFFGRVYCYLMIPANYDREKRNQQKADEVHDGGPHVVVSKYCDSILSQLTLHFYGESLTNCQDIYIW